MIKLKDDKVYVVVKEQYDSYNYHMDTYRISRVFKDIRDAKLFGAGKEEVEHVKYEIVTMIVD